MAVAQGYGKTVTSGSVFAYDTGDTRNSYIGEPTVNAISSASTMASWTNYYRTVASSTFTTEFGTTGYRFVNQPSWNGVYRNFNLGSTGFYTFSAWFRYNGGSAANNGATVYISNYGGGDTAAGLDKSLVGIWQRVSFTVNVTSPSNVYFYLISYGGTDNGTGNPDFSSWEVTMPQIELNSHATPFVNGTRSATQGLLPLVGNSTIDLTNVSFNSNAQMTFDGTNDYIDFNAPNLGSTATVEMVCKIGSGYSDKMFMGWSAYDVWCGSGHLGYNTANGDVYGISSSTVSSLGLVSNWKHYIFEMRSDVAYTNNKIYINGALQTLSQQLSGEAPGNRNFNSGNGRIADWRLTGYYMPMDCAVFKVYNRALSAGEVRQNYLHYKTRFNLS